MTMTIDIPTECPKCHHKFFFKTKSKRPNPTCPECSHKFYIKSSKSSQPRSEPIKDTRSIPPLSTSNGHSDHLTAELLEKLILNALQEDTTPAMVRCAVEFYSKVTAKEGEEVENIDLTGFLKVFENAYTKASSD